MTLVDENNLRKAAIFVMALGPEAGGAVMAMLPEDLAGR